MSHAGRPKQRVDEFVRREGLTRLLERTLVKTSRHTTYPNLVLLKYDMINSPMGDALTQQCRGIILDEADNWKVVSYPYNKFFNYGEGHAAEIDWKSARVYEKLDGSIMTLYFYNGQWQVASNGSPDANGPTPYNRDKTFRMLFWQTYQEMGYSLPKDTNMCYMFELMSPENRVVIPYKTNKLVLHGARYVTPKMAFAELDPQVIAEENGWECVKTYPLNDINSVLAMAETMKGIENEGFVVCDKNFNRLKLKVKGYLALHHLKGTMTLRRLMEMVQSNEGEEFLAYFPEYRNEFTALRNKFEALTSKAEADYEKHKAIESQKDFAMAVKDYPYSAGMFSTRKGATANVTTWFMNHDPRKILELLGVKAAVEEQPMFRQPEEL